MAGGMWQPAGTSQEARTADLYAMLADINHRLRQITQEVTKLSATVYEMTELQERKRS